METLDTSPPPSSDGPPLRELVCLCGTLLRCAMAWTAVRCGACASVFVLKMDANGITAWRAR